MPERTTIDELEKTPHAEVFEERKPRAVRLQLNADERVPAHTHPRTNIVLYLLSGHLDLSLDGKTYHLRGGDAMRFSGEREIEPHAVDRSTALVVFAPAVDG